MAVTSCYGKGGEQPASPCAATCKSLWVGYIGCRACPGMYFYVKSTLSVWEGIRPHLIHGFRASTSPHAKRHLDRFSHFVGLSSVTKRHTDGPVYFVCSNRPRLLLWGAACKLFWRHSAVSAVHTARHCLRPRKSRLSSRAHGFLHKRSDDDSLSMTCSWTPRRIT